MSGDAKSEATGWLDRQLSRFSNWRARERVRAELEGLAATGDLDQVLSDVGLNRSDLPALLAQDPGAAVGLREMAERLGVTSQALALSGGRSDLERRCLNCDAKMPCEQWLDQMAAPKAAPSFCPNAEELNALKRRVLA